MSKDPSNPFSRLNARDFPSRSRRDSGRKIRRSPTVVKDKAREEAVRDADEALFLEAVEGTVKALGGHGASEKKNAKESGCFSVEENDAFAQALKDTRVMRFPGQKEKPCPTPLPERRAEPDQEEEPATLTAMALAGMRIARSGDGPSLQQAAGEDDEEGSRDFLRAVKGTRPLHHGGRDVPPEPEQQPAPCIGSRHPLQDFMDGKVEFSVASTAEYAEGHVVGLDLSLVGRLQARQFSPEAHIDLHGLNSEQAFHTLVGFFRSSYYKGVRVALVVTGRGLNSPNGTPVLRGRVQEWFTQDPFKRVVLAFCSARQEDGGTGAFYVLLRRYKKNAGKIRWDVLPSDPDLYL